MKKLELNEYRQLIHLDEPYEHPNTSQYSTLNEDSLRILVLELLGLLRIDKPIDTLKNLNSYSRLRQELYMRLISRPPSPLPNWFYSKLDLLYQYENYQKEIFEAPNLTKSPEITKKAIWQGDITTLKIDAIVNAANEQMLGCFIPFHRCIDNAIHAAAGPKLREDCFIIMQTQGSLEPTGFAKITRGYNLPSSYVLHTVGPVYKGSKQEYFAGIVSDKQQSQLASCYRECLNVALEVRTIRTLAFCCISTGIFGFPKEKAAKIALSTVDEWVGKHSHRFDLILFNVYNDEDMEIYRNYLP